MLQHGGEVVLGVRLDCALAGFPCVPEQLHETLLRLREVAASLHRDRPADSAEQLRVAVPYYLCPLLRLCIRRVRLVEPVQLAVHAAGAERQRHRVGPRSASASNAPQRVQRIKRLFQVERVFQEMRVREQAGGEEADVALAVCGRRARDEAMQMTPFRRDPSQVAAEAIRGGPLILEGIGGHRIARGLEQVDEPQREKRPLPEPRLPPLASLGLGDAVQKDGVG